MKFKTFTIFYILTFLLLGLIPLFSALLNDGSMNFDEAAGRASQVTGIEWTSNLAVVLRLSVVEPILILTLLGSAVPSIAAILMLVPALLAIAFLDQDAVLEELGWRGFATPELQDAGVAPLKVAIIVGVCWGFWHLPRDITTGVIERLGISSYLTLYLPSFVLGTISVSVIASYFMNRLGGSVIPAIVVHGITNDAVGLSGSAHDK